jgi:serine/threonine protein kinase KIN1/2
MTVRWRAELRRGNSLDGFLALIFIASCSPSSPPGSPLSNSSLNSQSTLFEGKEDPLHGFHPLISAYFLAREKLERERVYGLGHFASSQLSILEAPPPPQPTTPKPSTVTHTPKANDEKADYNMALPQLPVPETSHYSGMLYDPNNAKPYSPTAASFHPQIRSRNAGDMAVSKTPTTPTPLTTQALPKAPPASTHIRSHSLSQRSTVLGGRWVGIFGGGDKIPEGAEMNEKVEEEDGTLTPIPGTPAVVPSTPTGATTPTGGTLAGEFGRILSGDLLRQ